MENQHDVLVVEDDKMLNKLICHYVTLAGHTFRSALDGTTALRLAQERTPTLVLLDLMLPDTTGFDVCTQLKHDSRTQGATVVIVTALDEPESRKQGMECGATEYMLKPFQPDNLIETIKRYAA